MIMVSTYGKGNISIFVSFSFSMKKMFYIFPFLSSRAIMMYLADQYGKNDSLYPKDVKKRAIVNQRLYFDMCNLYKSFMDYVIVSCTNYSIIFKIIIIIKPFDYSRDYS